MRILSRFNAALRSAVLLATASTVMAARTMPTSKRVRGAVLLGTGEDVFEEKPRVKVMGTKHTAREVEKAFGERLPKDLRVVEDFKCNIRYTVMGSTEKDKRCPDECPFLAQDKTDNRHCTFRCVENAQQCKEMNPKAVIPDRKLGICRKPMAQACKEYNYDGTDTCARCNSLYYVGKDGLCYGKLTWLAVATGVLLGIVFFISGVWIADLSSRPPTNLAVLKDALNFRSFQKLRTGKEDGRRLWPLDTNLLRTSVAGPGMMLHFNFQFWVIIWALCIGIGWMVMAAVVDNALFIIGTRKFGTPFTNCVLVAWGYETQQKLMWTKVLFLTIVYSVSFLGSLAYSVRQLRMFQCWDFDNKTMKDFVLLLEHLPPVHGNERMEENIQDCIEEACGNRPVGVSIGWEYENHEPMIMQLVESDLAEDSKELQSASGSAADDIPPQEHGALRKQFYKLEDAIFGPGEPMDLEGKTVKEILEGLSASPNAFAVFATQNVRDEAFEKLKVGGFEYKGCLVKVKQIDVEPDTVQWQFLGQSTNLQKLFRLFKGFFAIFVALLFWTVVFYLPYAWSVFSFNYDNGQEPGPIYSIAFSMVVVVGNQIMYEVCARVSENVGYRFADHRAACYMILFTVACLYNVLVDMVTTYFMSEQIMMELGFRTYYGEKLKQVGTFTERFETYAMQRTLAENTYRYAFPATFLIPFLLEPFPTILLPLKFGIWIVRSHPELTGRDAENLVASIPMDMGRYADILLNVMLGILIFYFPGGYTHWLFLGMVGSHMFIYAFDHYRLLRTVPQLTISTMDVDWWSQFMLAPCCALTLSCLVFKANCQNYGFCLNGVSLVGTCTGAFVLHCILHWLLLIYLVPFFGKPEPEDELANVTFAEVCSRLPCSWFTVNPVHCLRSRHIYQHEPPCRFLFSGKEHMLKQNEKIGCFFEDKEPETEDFSHYTGEKPINSSIRESIAAVKSASFRADEDDKTVPKS